MGIDFKNKVKKSNNLGIPPKMTEIKGNLRTPELVVKEKLKPVRSSSVATKIKAESFKKLKILSAQYEISMAQIIEDAIELYEKRLKEK